MPTPRDTLFPLKHIRTIIHNATGLKVSKGALEKFHALLETYAKDLASKSNDAALHAGRRTILSSDVDFATKTRRNESPKHL